MGIFERFEKRVEGAVNGVFARAFKGDVQPVEIAARLQRELDAEAKLMSRDKRLVPNVFEISLSQHDHDKLAPYGKTLATELSTELRSHAHEMGYVFNGPIRIVLKLDPKLPTGRFTVTSEAVAGVEAAASVPSERAPLRAAAPAGGGGGASSGAQLVLEVNGTRHPLQPPGLTIGRGTEADLRISDPGISRLHAQIRVSGSGAGQQIDIVDLGSTNGITVNGRKVQRSALGEGSRIEIGSTRMLVHAPGGAGGVPPRMGTAPGGAGGVPPRMGTAPGGSGGVPSRMGTAPGGSGGVPPRMGTAPGGAGGALPGIGTTPAGR